MILCDLHDLADAYAAIGNSTAEVEVRSAIGTADPLDQYNLVAALADAGCPVTIAALYEVASRLQPWDPMLAHVLDVLADEVDDEDESRLLRAHAEALRDGR